MEMYVIVNFVWLSCFRKRLPVIFFSNANQRIRQSRFVRVQFILLSSGVVCQDSLASVRGKGD